MEIYIAFFAGLLASLLLAMVYAADRWEREPVELIQNSFLTGMLGQLVLVVGAVTVLGELLWAGSWNLVTGVFLAVSLPYQLHRQAEVNERFDGIVYAVAVAAGAVCAIHLFNLPQVMAASPYRDAVAPGAAPDLRDLLIVTASPEFAAELGRSLVILVAAVAVGTIFGVVRLRGWAPGRTALACASAAVAVVAVDLVSAGMWLVRGVLLTAAFVLAAAVKQRSVFRDRPQAAERDLVVAAIKTVLMIFGSALLATVVIHGARARSDGQQAPVPVSGAETSAEAGPR